MHARGWFRWWSLPVAAIGLLGVAVAAGSLLYLTREEPEEKSLEEAIEEFRDSPDADDGADGSDADDDGDGDDEITLRPPAGVYLADGEGQERISFLGVEQRDGATIPVTIEHLPEGCWRLTVDYNEAHWQDWTLCPGDGGLVETGGTTFQAWDFGATQIENTSNFDCEPPNLFFDPDAEVGDTWNQSCTGTNSQIDGETVSSGPVTVVARETLDIGGTEVDTVHYREQRTIGGAQEGSNTTDWWFTEDQVLPVRAERTVEVGSPSPLGTITYTEQGWWELTSLDPQR